MGCGTGTTWKPQGILGHHVVVTEWVVAVRSLRTTGVLNEASAPFEPYVIFASSVPEPRNVVLELRSFA